jgi:ribose 1,5-bisphosphokinase PhnN
MPGNEDEILVIIFRSSFPLLHSMSMHFPSLASPVLFMSSHIMNERLKEKGRTKREEDGDPTLLIYYKVTFLW